MTRTLADRWASKVQKTEGCWLWMGAKRGHGYGAMFDKREDGKRTNVAAHRVSWELAHGPVPPGKQVLHRCDVPHCVNPDHLFVGDRHDNMRDMAQKGRRRGYGSGIHHHSAKLSHDDVRTIRRAWREGRAIRALARDYNLARTSVKCILTGRSWRDVAE